MPSSLILDRYRYISRLGTGGSSTVLLAEDTLLGRPVALKRIHASGDVAARSRLRREALIGASLSHPNLVSIFDIITEEGQDVIVMEYVEGETLADRLERGEKPSPQEALALLDGIAAALDTIHARGVVHRDVKPANVLLGRDGQVKLADLGIAAVSDGTQITASGTVLGTFRYMAPEQLEGDGTSPAIDIYALAAVAFEVLSGEKARHEPNPLALAHAIATQPPPDLRRAWPAAPAAAAQMLTRGMSRDPKLRPSTAQELTDGLRAAFEPEPIPARAAPRPEPIPAPRARRSRAALIAALAVALAAAAVAAIVLTSLGGNNGQRLASRPSHHAVGAASAHRSRKHVAPAHATTPPSTTTSSSTTSAGQAATISAADTGGSPASTVESFYRLAASHQYAAAWALADPAFRQQMQGYSGLEGTMSQTRSITFDGVDVVNQSPNSAIVSVRTTSVRTGGTQNCSGTVDLLRAGSGTPSWQLDHIDIACA